MESLVQALKFAMSKGDSLEKAMESLYYAGYDKKDIEDAARIILQEKNQQSNQSQGSQSNSNNNVSEKKSMPSPPPSKPLNPVYSSPVAQKVSSYGTNTSMQQNETNNKNSSTSYYQKQNVKPKTDWILLIMIFVLLLLISGLIATILFKPQIINFFNEVFN